MARLEEVVMILALVAAMAMQSNVPNTWNMGGGRTWMSPPGRHPSMPSIDVGFVTLAIPMEPGDPINGRTWLVPPKLPDCLPNGYCFTAKELEAAKKESESAAAAKAMRNEAQRIEGLARKGNIPEMARYGYMLLNGLMVPRDEVAAMGWFYEAAQKDDGMSMYALSCGFKNGVGVATDPKLAAFWQDRAAKKGFTRPC